MKCGFLTKAQRDHDLVTSHLMRVPYSYPVPTLDRDQALETIHHWFESKGICTGAVRELAIRGANTDHAVMMGVELVERLLLDRHETVWLGESKIGSRRG